MLKKQNGKNAFFIFSKTPSDIDMEKKTVILIFSNFSEISKWFVKLLHKLLPKTIKLLIKWEVQ